MKKIPLLILLLFMLVFVTACNSVNTEEVNESTGEAVALEESENKDEDLDDNAIIMENRTIEDYIKLVDLNKQELLESIDEEVQYGENNALIFEKTGIEISLGSIGESSEVATKISFVNSNIDFNGAHIGSKIEDFTTAFNNEIRSGDDFKYFQLDDNLILAVEFNANGDNKGIVTKVELMNPME